MKRSVLENLDTLNFAEFQQARGQLQEDYGEFLCDYGETNLWRALAPLVPQLVTEANERVHRCHLAQQWLAHWRLPEDWAPRALVSTGVRHSLSLIFQQLAANGIPLILPSDVYPVYGELARAAHLPFQTFTTLNGSASFSLPETTGWVVLPFPLKPAGRVFSEAERIVVHHWLAADARRRVVIDAVYTFDPFLDPAILELFATQQAIVLHSLSKSWLQPKIFGIALIPTADQDLLSPTFRENPPTQLQLTQARAVMAGNAALPFWIHSELARRRQQLLRLLPAVTRSLLRLPVGSSHAGYLMSCECSASQLWAEHGILAIPATVFGSTRMDCSILSTLSFQ